MSLAFVLLLLCLSRGWPSDDSVPLTGLYVSLLSTEALEVVRDGVVTTQFHSPGLASKIFDESAVIAFRLWTSPQWRDETMYILVQGESMHVIPLYYLGVPDVFSEKRISDTVLLEKEDVRDFSIGFDCISEARESIQVQIRPYESRRSLVEFYFEKSCSKGPRRDLSLWLGQELAAVGGVVGEEWMEKGKEIMGAVDVKIEIAQGNVMITKVMASGNIPMDVRGQGARGGLVSNSTVFTLFPDCRSDVQSGTVYLTVKLPPYDDLHLLWTQVCYRPVVPDPLYTQVSIGTQVALTDIISAGITQGNYTHGQPVRISTFSSTFFMPVSSPVNPADIRLTYDTHILMPEVECTEVMSEYSCKLTYRCYNKGESSVVVTLPTADGNVEFSYLKYCKQPRVITSSDVSLTPYFLSSGIVVFLVLCYFCRRNKSP